MKSFLKPAWFAAALALPLIAPAETPAGPVVAIEHVNLISMVPGRGPEADMTVVLRGDKIESIAPAATASVPSGARRVNGAGKWLMPSLVDAHVHTQNSPDTGLSDEEIFLPYVANGVLQIINFSASPAAVQMRPQTEDGQHILPHMAFSGLVDGKPPIRPTARTAGTPEEGRAYVREIKADGYDFVKTYSNLTLETFTAIVDEARKVQIPVIGHIPERGKGEIEKMILPGFTLIAHAEELAYQVPKYLEVGVTDDFIPQFVSLIKKNGTVVVSTVVVMESILAQVENPGVLAANPGAPYIPSALLNGWTDRNRNGYLNRAWSKVWTNRIASVARFNPRFLRACVDAGIPVLAGTDAPLPGLAPGFSLHDELELLVRAGLTNEETLAAATRVPVEWLGAGQVRGTVVAGKRADLLLLDANPLEHVKNARKIAAVYLGGRELTRADLDQRMAALAAHIVELKPSKPTGLGGF